MCPAARPELAARMACRAEKTTDQEKALLSELRQEAGLMASLRHPNVVLFLGVCFKPPAMLTEFCARGSLLDILRKGLTNEASMPCSCCLMLLSKSTRAAVHTASHCS